MSLLSEQIAKARSRARGLDLEALAESRRAAPHLKGAPPSELSDRREFLQENLGDLRQSKIAFERIIEGNELQPVNYLELGALAAHAICRIKLFDPSGSLSGWASGFLIAPNVLLTNNHVLPTADAARHARAQFDVELDIFGADKPMIEFGFEPDRLFYTSAALDFSVAAVSAVGDGGRLLSDYGFLPLIGATGKVIDGEWLTIIQHPGGERKQVCVRENQLLTRTDDVLWYSTDTLGGSSGSPVFNNSWQVVALHHKGVPEEKNGRIQTLDGRDYDPGRDAETAIKWVANEGVRVSRIVAALRAERPGHELLGDVFNMTPARAREVTTALVARMRAQTKPNESEAPLRRTSPMTRSINVTFDLAEDGSVMVRGAPAMTESRFQEKAPSGQGGRRSGPDVDAPFDFKYESRNGYQEDFLGSGFLVHPPSAGDSLKVVATRLLTAKEGSKNPEDYTLKYKNFSVMLHADRRLALWTAASVDGGNRYQIGRTSDDWRYDPRVPRAAQLGNFYYKNNQFDRGHLTRREDMEYGATLEEAVGAADDTCHWSNCTPQHAKFNELGYLWQDLEKHILEGAIKAKRFGAQVFTGPILDEGDPVWDRFPDIQYPVRFWKIAVALTSSDNLFAAGFILDQSAAIQQSGIEAAVEIPFGPFRTFQVPISEIEEQTGLTFTFSKEGAASSLSAVDPLGGGKAKTVAARRRRVRTSEAFDLAVLPAGYVPIYDGASIIRD